MRDIKDNPNWLGERNVHKSKLYLTGDLFYDKLQ